MISVAEPDLPELEPLALAAALDGGGLIVDGALLAPETPERVSAKRIRISESSVRLITIEPCRAADFRLHDAVLHACDLSNVDAGEGSVRRVQVTNSKLVGFSLTGGTVHDLSVVDSSLALASLAFVEFRDVVFQGVDLREASFTQATFEGVEFAGCELAGADFRDARVKGCTIRGSSLDGVIGIESLAGVVMPWSDVIASAGALADALGIRIADDD